jgi:hypothetical protein
MLKGKVETIKTRLKSMQGMNPAFATGHKLGLIDVSMFVSLARVDERSRISPSLPRLRWRRFWHACCIVGATAHVPRLHFSGDHLEDVWRLLRNILVSAGTLCYLAEIRNPRWLPRYGIFILLTCRKSDSRCFFAGCARLAAS